MSEEKPKDHLFQPGNKFGLGRKKGSRVKLGAEYLADLYEVWLEAGTACLHRLARRKNPAEFCRLVAMTLPKEFEINDNRLKELTDEQLDVLIAVSERYSTRELARLVDRGEEPTTH